MGTYAFFILTIALHTTKQVFSQTKNKVNHSRPKNIVTVNTNKKQSIAGLYVNDNFDWIDLYPDGNGELRIRLSPLDLGHCKFTYKIVSNEMVGINKDIEMNTINITFSSNHSPIPIVWPMQLFKNGTMRIAFPAMPRILSRDQICVIFYKK